jgi:hypothetical protein
VTSLWFQILVKAEDAAALLKQHFALDEAGLQVLRINLEILLGSTISGRERQVLAIQAYLHDWNVSQPEREEFFRTLIQDGQWLTDLLRLLKNPGGWPSWWSQWSTKMKSCLIGI